MERITNLALYLLEHHYTKSEFSEKVGISRPTLDTRLKEDNWKKSEANYIESISK